MSPNPPLEDVIMGVEGYRLGDKSPMHPRQTVVLYTVVDGVLDTSPKREYITCIYPSGAWCSFPWAAQGSARREARGWGGYGHLSEAAGFMYCVKGGKGVVDSYATRIANHRRTLKFNF